MIGNKLVCANVGDARAILCRNGTAVDLSVDHKAVKLYLFTLVIIVERRRIRKNKEVGWIYRIWKSLREACCNKSFWRFRL